MGPRRFAPFGSTPAALPAAGLVDAEVRLITALEGAEAPALLPNVPTVVEAGVKDDEATIW